jgi:hypothetical protein
MEYKDEHLDKIKKTFMSFFIIVIPVGLAGCQGFSPVEAIDDSSEIQNVKAYGSCDRKSVNLFNMCSELNGADYDDADYLDVLKTNCEATGGVFSSLNCDRTGSVGTCIVGKNQSNEVRTSYYPPQNSSETAQADCDANGGKFKKN